MDDFTIEITIEGDLSSLTSALLEMAEKATLAGCNTVIAEHEKLVHDWSEPKKPKFNISAPERVPDGVSRTITLVDSQIWNWVDKGTKPVVIDLTGSGRVMRFKWTGDRSYDSSYSPKTRGGSGEQMGEWFKTPKVGVSSLRYIRARNLRKKAIDNARVGAMLVMAAEFK